MPCWRALSLCLIGLATGCGADAPDTGLRVTDMRAGLAGNEYSVTVSLDIELTEAVLEALHNGVPITVQVENRLRQPRRWLWARTLASESRRYTLTYQSLSAQYVILWPDDAGYRAYPSRHVAFAALESPETWRTELPDEVPAGATLVSETRARLDLQELPAPLRLMAYFSSDWRIGSGWHREKLTR